MGEAVTKSTEQLQPGELIAFPLLAAVLKNDKVVELRPGMISSWVGRHRPRHAARVRELNELDDGRWRLVVEFVSGAAGGTHAFYIEPSPAGPTWEVLGEHFQVCGSCLELWPCARHSAESDGGLAAASGPTCAFCGKAIRNTQRFLELPSGRPRAVYFHTRKFSACRAAFEQAARDEGHYEAIMQQLHEQDIESLTSSGRPPLEKKAATP